MLDLFISLFGGLEIVGYGLEFLDYSYWGSLDGGNKRLL